MKVFECQKCGGRLSQIGEGLYRCECCGKDFKEDHLERELSALSLLLSAEKQEQVGHLRQLLWEESHKAYIDRDALRNAAHDLRKLLPDDKRAAFYEAACSQNPHEMVTFLKELDTMAHEDDLEEMVAFLIKSLKPQWIAHVANLIEIAFNHEGALPLYSEWSGKLEEEAAKIQQGIYDVSLPRDVFLAYSSADTSVVLDIADYLEEHGISCFVALRNLQHGVGAVQNYESSLKKAMDACEIFVLVSSSHSRSNQCDAFTKEMAYLRDKEMHDAPPQYHKHSYDSLPDKYKKKRIEYVIDQYRNTPFDMVTKQFFAGLTWCRSLPDLATRLLLLRNSALVEDDETVKYCRQCGADCASDERSCKKCGGQSFFATKEAYDEYKKQEEELKRQRDDLERQKALQEAEMLRRQLEIEKSKAGGYSDTQNAPAILKRAYIYIEDELWEKAAEYCERALDANPTNAEAYLCKLMIDLKCSRKEDLSKQPQLFDSLYPCKKAMQYGSDELKGFLQTCTNNILARLEQERIERERRERIEREKQEEELRRNWSFEIKDDTSTIIKYTGSESHVIIPDIIQGKPVKEIGEKAFFQCTTLTSVTIPDSVTSIDIFAFMGCAALTSVTIPDSVTSIGNFAFSKCTSLTSVTIGNSVTSIGEYAFIGCSSLTSVTISDGVTSIGDSAFMDCDCLTSVTIPNSVTSIGEWAFSDCSSLTSVTFENTKGWKADNTSISSTDLANTATAAQYLKNTYSFYSWTRT